MISALLALGSLYSVDARMIAPIRPPIVRKVGTRDIEVVWPRRDAKVPAARRVSHNGVSVFGGPRGEVLDAAQTDDAWGVIASESEELAKSPSAGVAPWKVKVFVIQRADILNHGDYLRPRRGAFEKADFEHVYQSLARAAQAIEVKARGRIKVSFDVEIDAAEDFEDAGPGLTPFDDEWLAKYVTPRVNGFDFKSDDKVYRGPWDSVWVVHSGLVDRVSTVNVWGTPCDGLPYYWFGPGRGDGALAEAMTVAWERGVGDFARRGGYEIPAGWKPREFGLANGFPLSLDGGSTALSDPASAVFRSRSEAKGSTAGVSWAGIRDDPLGKLGWLTREDVAKIAEIELKWEERGESIFVHAPSAALLMQSPDISLDGLFSPGREASALVRLQGKSLWLVDVRFANLLGTIPDAKVHGFLDLNGTPCLVLAIATPPPNTTEWDLFGLPAASISKSNPTQADSKVFSGSMSDVVCHGFFRAEASRDASRPATDIRLGFAVRQGRAILFDGYAKNQFIDAKSTPVFRVWLKASNVEPLLIKFESDSPNWPSPVARIYGRWPTPEDGQMTPATEISVAPDGQWHEVVIDVRALSAATGQMRIRRISVESDPLATLWGGDPSGAAISTVGPITVEATSAPVVKYDPYSWPEPSPTSTNEHARARWAATAGAGDVTNLIELLKDRWTIVRINAAASLGNLKGTNIEAALADSLNTLDPRLAQQSIFALKNQNTEFAWNTILKFFNGPPAEGHRLFALKALAERKDSRNAGTLTASFAAPSWRSRLEGALAIATIGTPDADTLLMVFLQEANPEIRLAVVQRANMTIDKVGRRILYTAVNDSSEAVRLASLIKLLSATAPELREEGFKGVRDDSQFVRVGFLEYLAKNPHAESRQALQIAAVDSDPVVKAAALGAWAKFPGEVKREELADAFESQDLRVVRALAALLKAKTISSFALFERAE